MANNELKMSFEEYINIPHEDDLGYLAASGSKLLKSTNTRERYVGQKILDYVKLGRVRTDGFNGKNATILIKKYDPLTATITTSSQKVSIKDATPKFTHKAIYINGILKISSSLKASFVLKIEAINSILIISSDSLVSSIALLIKFKSRCNIKSNLISKINNTTVTTSPLTIKSNNSGKKG